LTVNTDGPVTVRLAGCERTVRVATAGTVLGATACATATALRRATAAPRGDRLRISYRRGSARGPARIEVLRQSTGRRVPARPVRVARFRQARHAVSWAAAGAPDGVYTVRIALAGDVRTLVVERRHGRFLRRAGSERRPSCGAIRGFRLRRPVFGGTAGRSLVVAVRLAPGVRGQLALRRGPTTIRRIAVRGRRSWRIGATGLRRGPYAVRLTAQGARATVHAVRL
jgi:hypothetical protein